MKPVAVVPVKRFALAKQRLRGYLDERWRQALARAMLEDVLDTLAAVPTLGGVLLVSDEPEAAPLAHRRGMAVLDEAPGGGLNAAVRAAATHLGRRRSSAGERPPAMLILPADAPGVSRAEIEQLLAFRELVRAPLVLVPAHDRGGTNAMLLDPPDILTPAFGADSFRRHRHAARAAGLHAAVLELPGLALDLDQPCDLQRFARTRTETRAWRLLQAHAAECGVATLRPAPDRPGSAQTSFTALALP